ncbi:MAG: GNAT family N-acetyltransferase [Clostridiales bacterium]|jgi:aminoglycoside 6'-N-acetyltransferase I|nr:GNAT family N-acetyltransferase [Clostridiales bacterium]
MTSQFSVVEYGGQYKDAAAKMFFSIYQNEPFNYDWMTEEHSVAYFTDMEQTPHFLGYVLLRNNEIAGMCLGQIEEHFMTPGYKINELFIDGENQHMGIGSFFLTEVENLLRNRGIKAMYLFTSKNVKAYEFYKRHDFVANEETVYMAKLIKPETTTILARNYLTD